MNYKNQHVRILDAINKLSQETLRQGTIEDVGKICIDVAAELTNSPYGYIGLIDKAHLFSVVAVTDAVWQDCNVVEATRNFSRLPVRGIWGECMACKKTVIIDDMENYRHNCTFCVKRPDGHIGLKAFLGVPFFHEGESLGMIAVANKPDGYRRQEREYLEAITPVVSVCLQNKLWNAELQRSNEELAQFAYIASHDLKAPLRAVNNLATWIEEDMRNGKDISQYLALMQNRVTRMDNLIDGLLEYSRIGRMETNRRSIELELLIKDIEEDLEISLTKNLQCKQIIANPVRIRQLLTNLLENAVKHHNNLDNIQIKVESNRREEMVEFSISDNGPGIAPEHHERIFRIFQTLKPKDETGTTGMGLALVEKIVSEYSGTIVVESELGQGSTFRFTLRGV